MQLKVKDIVEASSLRKSSREAQSVARLTKETEVSGLIPGSDHTFMETDHAIFSTVIFSFRRFKKGICQLLAKVRSLNSGQPSRRTQSAQEKYG